MPPKAKPGEGIVVVVDVGPGVRAGVDNTFFNQSKKCLLNIMQRKMFAEKCLDLVGIVLFGTDTTDNNLAKDGQYKNITVLQAPRLVTWEGMSKAEELPRGNTQGDWVDALVVAIDLLHDPDGIRFSTKKIVMMTDFSSEFSDDQVSPIISGIKKLGIDFSVIGPEVDNDDDDDDDDEAGPSNGPGADHADKLGHMNWNGKPKSQVQLAGEALAQRIVTEVDGIICSFDEAIPQLIFFQKKTSGSGNWNCVMDIGRNLKIPIVGKIKVKRSTPASYKKAYAQDESAAIMSEVSHHLQDEAQTAVDQDDITYGYRYGTTLVPFSDEDNQMKYSSEADGATLSVLGFTKSSFIPPHLRSGEQVLVITAREGDENAAIALSSIIQGLAELEMVAVTRRIYRKNLNPMLGALYPDITTNYECFIWVPLPFQEDVREFSFPSLQRNIDKLTESERDSMDDLITAMNLSPQDDDEEEELEPSSVLNPQLQHFFNCLTQRAIDPEQPLPTPAQYVKDILAPPSKVIDGQKNVALKLATAFPIKKIIRNTKRDRENLFANDGEPDKKVKTDGAGDTTVSITDLTRGQVTRITTATPVQDFKALLMDEAPNYNKICKEMDDVILQLLEGVVDTSVGGGSMAIMNKVVGCLKVFRTEAILINPSPYNSFIPKLKQLVSTRTFTSLWDVVKQDGLGLISETETLKSNVKVDAADSFLKLEDVETRPATPPKEDQDDDYDDMLDDL